MTKTQTEAANRSNARGGENSNRAEPIAAASPEAADAFRLIGGRVSAERPWRPKNIAIENLTGGLGKTLLAQVATLALLKAGLEPTVAAADQASGGRSAIAGMVDLPVIELGVGPQLDAEGAPISVVGHWDTLVPVLQRDHVVVDVGANVALGILAWGKEVTGANFFADYPLAIVVPVTASETAARDALEILRLAGDAEVKAGLEIRDRFVAFNEVHGPTAAVGGAMDRLRAYCEQEGIKTLRIPALRITARDVSIVRLADMTITAYANILPAHVDIKAREATAARELRLVRQWLNIILDAMAEVGLTPRVPQFSQFASR